MEIGSLPEKEYRIMIVKMIQDLGKRIEAKIKKVQEMFNKDLEEYHWTTMKSQLQIDNNNVDKCKKNHTKQEKSYSKKLHSWFYLGYD